MQKSLILCLLSISLLFAACADPLSNQPLGQLSEVGVEPGKPAPNFFLPDQFGKTVRLSDYSGKVVYLDFWASWCDPCRALLPDTKDVWDQYRDKDFVVIGVSLDYTTNAWKKFIADQNLDWVQTFDDGKSVGSAVALYTVRAIPQSYLIGKDGVVIGQDLYGSTLRDSLDVYVNK